MGNACLSGAVNAPKRRGRKPLPPIHKCCLQCGTGFVIRRRGKDDVHKKFCNNSCATHYNMALRHGLFYERCKAIEPCLRCHDRLDLKARVSGQLVGLGRAFAMRRRRRMGYNPARVITATHKRVCEAKGPEREGRRLERRVMREQRIAWTQEWAGVRDCWHGWYVGALAKSRARKYLWQANKRATDMEWRERNRLRGKTCGIKKATPRSVKHIAELGCSYWEAKKHIERLWLRGMSWDNHGEVWEIDHIVPASRFDAFDAIQRLQMNHFTNLQPLWRRDNRRKLNRVDPRSSLQLVML